MPLSLSAWESFYVIAGSSGAALTGLMFVVIALAPERMIRTSIDGVSAFSTPTVAHFAGVLVIASVMAVPIHTTTSLAICLALFATAGLVSTGRAGVIMKRLDAYSPEREDWTWHVILPLAAYVVLLAAAIVLDTAPNLALTGAAVVVIALLLIGIHNAWDVAVFLVAARSPDRSARSLTETPAPSSNVESDPVANSGSPGAS